MTITVRYNLDHDAYVCECGFNDRTIPKDAGFTWTKIVEKKWATRDEAKAMQLAQYADEPTKHRLRGVQQAREQAVSMSRASTIDAEFDKPDGLDYLPYQKVGIAYQLGRQGTLLADEMGLGKCQPVDAKLLTPDGWVEMGDIHVGDRVFGSDGKPHNVTGVFPQGYKSIYRVTFSDGSSTECCDEHLWTVNSPLRKWRGSPHMVKQLKEFMHTLHDAAGNRKWHIPVVEPIHFAERELPLDPYLLGCMIGNGYLAGKTLKFTTADAFTLEEVRTLLPEGAVMKHVQRYDHSINSASGMKATIKDLNLNHLANAKHIPDIYKFASIEQRVALLQGLMDTDGSVTICKGTPILEYVTVSKILSEDVQFLVESLGGRCAVGAKVSPKYTYRGEVRHGQDAYRLNISFGPGIEPFRIPRKAKLWTTRTKYLPTRAFEKVEYIGEKKAQCIAVDAPDHLYVTDHCILTHNTIQTIGLINNDPGIQRVLIVCPKGLKLNWKQELSKWLTRPMTVEIVTPDGVPDADILICNYDILHRFDFDEMEWDLVAGDEIHLIKNPKSRRSRAFTAINGRRNVGMTGTPIVNRPAELFPILHWVDPVTWPKFWPYAQRYCDAKQGKYGWELGGASNLPELQQKLRETVMIRRMKADVLKELPPKRRSVVVIPSNGSAALLKREQEAYDRHQAAIAEARAQKDLAQASDNKEAYAQAVARLRAMTGVMLQDISRLRHETAVAKAPHVAEHVLNILEDNDGYKVIVFAHHKDVVDLLMDKLKAYRPVKVTGDVSMTARQAAVDAFQNDPGVQVFVGNIQAAGVGLTLTASSHVVFAELDWVPGNVSQAEDRAHRIGQHESVLIEHLVFDNSLDAKMAQTIIKKQAIIEQALDKQDDADEIATIDDPSTGSGQRAVSELVELTQAQTRAVHEAMRILAGSDTDHATQKNNVGFDRYSSVIGHSLADAYELSPKQAALGYKLSKRFRGQLPQRIREVLSL